MEEADARERIGGLENAIPPNPGGWKSPLPGRCVVEPKLSAGNRRAQLIARDGQTVNHFAELPHHFRFFRAAEVEAVGRRHGTRATRCDIASRFRDGVHRSYARIQLAPAAVSVSRKRQGALDDAGIRIFYADDGGIARAGSGERV